MVSKFILFVILSASSIQAAEIGVVGLGRTIFEPLCCYACLSSFWGLHLSCTPAQGPQNQRGSDPLCHSTNAPYLTSLAYCMQVKCAADNVSSSEIEQCWNKVAGDGLMVGSLEANLPSATPNITLAYDATSLDQTSLVDNQYYDDSRTTIQGYVKQESAHALYGTIIVATVVGVCFCLGFHRLVNYALPSLTLPPPISSLLSKYIYLPALVGSMHLRKFPGNLGYVPLRALTLLIICYIALNAALCAVNYPSLTPDTWYISSKKQHTSWIGNRLGVLSYANIALAIMFSGRNTPLLWITGCSRTDIITFHRWVARVAALESFIHVVLYWGGTNKDGYHMFTLAAGINNVDYNESYWNLGIIAIAALLLMVIVFSILPLRTKLYEIFLCLHILLGIVVLIGLWYHVVYRYHKAYGYEIWLYIAFAFWGFDRLSRPFRIVLLNWKSWFLPSHPSAIVELFPGDEFMKVTVFPSLTWNFSAGQHCFLYFPNLRTNPFQSHPFSIASWNDATKPQIETTLNTTSSSSLTPEFSGQAPPRHSTHHPTTPIIELQDIPLNITQPSPATSFPKYPSKPSISFLVRPEHGLTGHLHAHLLKCPKTSIPVLIEGPYGSAPTTKFHNADAILAIVGGIGITSILGYLELYLSAENKHSRPSRFVLVWTVREESLIAAVNSQIGDFEVLKGRGVEVRIVCTGNGEGGRVDAREVVVTEVMSEGGKGRKVCVICCGPGGLADSVRAAVVDVVGKKGVHVDLVEEVFCW